MALSVVQVRLLLEARVRHENMPLVCRNAAALGPRWHPDTYLNELFMENSTLLLLYQLTTAK